MTTIKQIIRLKLEKVSQRAISVSLGISRASVSKYFSLIEVSGIDYKDLLALPESDLDELFNTATPKKYLKDERYAILQACFPEIEKELKRVGVTKGILWAEYKKEHSDGYGYSRFNSCYMEWAGKKDVVMHFEHKAGEKIFVDYTGSKLEIVDWQTGEITKVEVFVAILGASQLTYAEASFNQKKENFIRSVENSFNYFGGVSKAVVPDNLRSAVTKSNKYEPEINESFQDFALHYQTTILPARAAKPRDKALVESAVNIIYKRIFAPLRNTIFHTIEALNTAMKEELEKHNNKAFQGKDHSRRELFNQIEKEALQPLPLQTYEFKTYKWLTVHKNSHIFLYEDHHYYSVPYAYTGDKVKLIYNSSQVEIFKGSTRIAFHKRNYNSYKYTTVKSHMPSAHNFIAEWNPEKFISWSQSIGAYVHCLIKKILESKIHPEQAYKSCLGVLSYAKKVGHVRLNKACKRAVEYELYNYGIIKKILEKGLEEEPMEEEKQYNLPFHDNIRGKNYYQ